MRIIFWLPLFFFSFCLKRRDYVVPFEASLTCARNFGEQVFGFDSPLETNKVQACCLQHVMANSDRKASKGDFWTSSSRNKQTRSVVLEQYFDLSSSF